MKSDIFFFITTVVVIVLGLLFLWLMVYLIAIFKSIREITGRAKTLFNATSDDVDELRKHIKEKGLSWSSLVAAFMPKKKTEKKEKKASK